MGQYAKTTDVSVGRSRDEIERILSRYGASRFAYSTDWESVSVISFVHSGRAIRITIALPAKEEFRYTETRRIRTQSAQYESWQQAIRQCWRALVLVVKAKLEAVDAGIATFEQEFMAYTILPDGRTFFEWANPQLAQIYESGYVPPTLALPAATIREEEE